MQNDRSRQRQGGQWVDDEGRGDPRQGYGAGRRIGHCKPSGSFSPIRFLEQAMREGS